MAQTALRGGLLGPHLLTGRKGEPPGTARATPPNREAVGPVATTSGNNQWQQPVATVSHCRTSMTMAQTAPLAFPATVPQEGWEEVQRRGPAAGNGQDGLPLDAPSPSGDRRAPGVRGAGCVRTVRPRRDPTRLKARRNPRSRQTEAPAGTGGGLRAGSQGPRSRARPPPASGAMPCLRRA